MAQDLELTTYEQVEKYVDELDALQPVGASGDLVVGMEQLCKYYKIVKPILNLVLNLPLIPEKFKKHIRTFMSILDTFCTSE